MREPRLPAPLPAAVFKVARANLRFFGVVCFSCGLFVAVSGAAVVVLPIALGRDGVGRAMITLFLFCAVAVVTGVTFLAARSAAQVLRRERRGVAALLGFVRLGAFLAALAAALAWWLSAAFFDGGEGTSRVPTYLATGACLLLCAFFLRSSRVLSGYRNSMRNQQP